MVALGRYVVQNTKGMKLTPKEPIERFVQHNFDQNGNRYEASSAKCSFYAHVTDVRTRGKANSLVRKYAHEIVIDS
jgi:hypothetical protein